MHDSNSTASTKSADSLNQSGRRANPSLLRPITNANEYYLNHGTYTRIYSKESIKALKKLRKEARRNAKGRT